jgi:hypothetical protein
MALQGPNYRNPLYPEGIESDPNTSSKPNSSSNLYKLYRSIDMWDLIVERLTINRKKNEKEKRCGR